MLDIIIKTINTAHQRAAVAVVTSIPANDIFVFYTSFGNQNISLVKRVMMTSRRVPTAMIMPMV